MAHVLLALLCLLTLVTSARAEGASMLWMMGASSPWDSGVEGGWPRLFTYDSGQPCGAR